MSETPTIQPAPAVIPPKKGMGPLGWVGIGCGGILIIVIAGFVFIGFKAKQMVNEIKANPEKAVAENIVKMHPDLDLVSHDDAAGEMTVKLKDGSTVTASYADLAEGKIELKDSEGNTMQLGASDLSQVPSWVPTYTGLGESRGSFHSETEKEITGSYSGITNDSSEAILEFYTKAATGLGFSSSSTNSTNVGGNKMTNVSFSGEKKNFTLILTQKSGSNSLVNVGYSEKK